MTMTAAALASAPSLGVATLVSWLVTEAFGAYMIATWVARGGLRQQRATGEGLPPGVITAHLGLAGTGLLLWLSYLVTGLTGLAWAAICLLVPAIGLGISTVTLWTPYPRHRVSPRADVPRTAQATGDLEGDHPAEIVDELLTDLFASAERPDPPRPSRHVAALIPFSHGVAAIATILLAVLTAVGSR
jgi:hypothetical protein